MKETGILLLEDVSSFRYMLQKRLADFGIRVSGSALDPVVAIHHLHRDDPDVIVLSLSMSSMDAYDFLLHLMKYHPLPVVAVTHDAYSHKRALDLGAFSCIERPAPGAEDAFINSLAAEIKRAALSKQAFVASGPEPRLSPEREVLLFDVVPMKECQKKPVKSDTIVAIGSSTGGTPVIERIFTSLPADYPAILVVQHMPENFTPLFADRLNRLSPLYVCEAHDGDVLYRGHALIAPGNYHLALESGREGFKARVTSDPPVNLFRPSVDVLFHSVARSAGSAAVAVLLTGMGGDGARGMLAIHEAGGVTVAQDEVSSAVFGMPREAIRIGAVRHVRDIDGIIHFLNTIG